ncbi:MAG TPA: DUF2007 domain-containing protein [Abditibacteriaceae bacterium]|jgi:hypothetical protein
MPETVIVASFPTELEAEILRGRLEADGIEAWLRGARVASTLGAVSEFNISWNNPLGGVEVWVRAEDADEAKLVLRAIHPPKLRPPQKFPNALQMVVGGGFALGAWNGGNLFHPLLGYLGVAVTLIATVILARK